MTLGRIPITALAFSLSAFLAITFLLCVAAGFFVPDLGTHAFLQSSRASVGLTGASITVLSRAWPTVGTSRSCSACCSTFSRAAADQARRMFETRIL